MNYYPFDSRNPLYRSHIGAVASGDRLKLRLLLHDDALCTNAFLIIRNDKNGQVSEIPLFPADYFEDYRFWDCEISLNTGLYWYSFKYTSAYGEFKVTKCSHSIGYVSSDGGEWQQTVYDSNFKTPEWLEGGVIYQIFPDRFYNSGKTKRNVPDDRCIVSDMSKTPEYRQKNGTCSLGNDYYGGDLQGITDKLPYIAKLGVNCIYLNPIFEAHSNHRYNTADYKKIDSLLGTANDLKKLCEAARKLNIRIILDGVFSHTGEDSVYFNKYGRYKTLGAYNSQKSKYFNWFNFKNWPDDYVSWWGIKSLPETCENDKDFCEFITGENGVIKHWMKYGISGWRLDVADELPDEFLKKIRTSLKEEKHDAYLLGEVWEDASHKVSYDKRREFLLGAELDSVMNYPFANAIVNFFKTGDAVGLVDTVVEITENYPAPAIKTLMNHLSTHDTVRIITKLSDSFVDGQSREWQSKQQLCGIDLKTAANRVAAAAAIQFTLPGIPSIFYGDEIGMQGYGDPFCRAYFPWDNINENLLAVYRKLGKLRQTTSCLKNAEFIPVHSNNGYIVFMRRDEKDAIVTAVNVNKQEVWAEMPNEFKVNPEIIFGEAPNCDGWIKIPPESFGIYKISFK